MTTQVVIAAYKPHVGKEKALENLIQKHVPALRKLKLITDRPSITLKSSDGTYLEIIEWRDAHSANQAHENPVIEKIWSEMARVSDFKALNQLPEGEKPFAHFDVIGER